MARKLTFTDPSSGKVYTRQSDIDYTHISIGSGGARWHSSREAAERTRNPFYALPNQNVSEGRKLYGRQPVEPSTAALCTVRQGSGICGKPAVQQLEGTHFGECAQHANEYPANMPQFRQKQ